MEKKNDATARIKERFVIIYDKFTKPMALSLRNSIVEAKETCVVWTEKVYTENECSLTNHNLLVLFNKKMIKDHLANPTIKRVNFSDGVILKHEGNTMGLMIDPDINYVDYKKKINISWKKYVWGTVLPILLAGGVPGAVIIATYMLFNDKKKIKTKLLFDAVEKLKAGTIEKFLSGEQLD